MTTLNDNYKEDLSIEEAARLATRVLKENMEQKIASNNFEISVVRINSLPEHLNEEQRMALLNDLQ